MVDIHSREHWLHISDQKPIPPYTLDPTLTFYCPQENVEAFQHPDVRSFHAYMLENYRPPKSGSDRAVALLLPCTKTKPYTLSKEHLEINRQLLEHGLAPEGEADYPTALLNALPKGYLREVLHNGLLTIDGLSVHRYVLSEPLGLVPYEHVYTWRGKPSIASRYDDPGLFEHRGTAVCLWRQDHTAVQTPDGKYRWGPAERAAYAQAHNFLSKLVAVLLTNLKPFYSQIIGYVSPKMTHRSFLSSAAEKVENHLPCTKQTQMGKVQLVGVNDRAPGLVEIIPKAHELNAIFDRLTERLQTHKKMKPGQVRAYFASGGGGATPLILPESVTVLMRHLIYKVESANP
jgi:hypothetical protein